jgi:F0F1-type ATP synthase assembly protein I
MKQTKAPQAAPTPPQDLPKRVKSPSTIFVTLALDMTWRLAIVVLVPVIGGFKLDEKLETTPLLTIVGFLIAMTGMALVVWKMMQKANEATMTKKDKKD